MPLDESAIQIPPDQYPAEPMPCLRCGAVEPMRFRGPCPRCAEELRAKFRGEARVVAGAEYEPTMHVTPNAVALKDD